MDKQKILETFFKTIDDSREWGDTLEGKEYYNFIDGAITMTKNLLDSLKETEE